MSLGATGEARAKVYLQAKGYTLLAENYRCPGSEIDLIMQDDDTLVFIEVKTRNSTTFGTALESITKKKLLAMLRGAEHFCKKNNIQAPFRLDAICIQNGVIEHYENLSPEDL